MAVSYGLTRLRMFPISGIRPVYRLHNGYVWHPYRILRTLATLLANYRGGRKVVVVAAAALYVTGLMSLPLFVGWIWLTVVYAIRGCSGCRGW